MEKGEEFWQDSHGGTFCRLLNPKAYTQSESSQEVEYQHCRNGYRKETYKGEREGLVMWAGLAEPASCFQHGSNFSRAHGHPAKDYVSQTAAASVTCDQVSLTGPECDVGNYRLVPKKEGACLPLCILSFSNGGMHLWDGMSWTSQIGRTRRNVGATRQKEPGPPTISQSRTNI